MKVMNQYPMSFKATHDIAVRLDKLSKETARPKSHYIALAVTEYLDDLEDYYLAEKRYAELVAGNARTYTLAEVRKEIELGN